MGPIGPRAGIEAAVDLGLGVQAGKRVGRRFADLFFVVVDRTALESNCRSIAADLPQRNCGGNPYVFPGIVFQHMHERWDSTRISEAPECIGRVLAGVDVKALKPLSHQANLIGWGRNWAGPGTPGPTAPGGGPPGPEPGAEAAASSASEREIEHGAAAKPKPNAAAG